MHPPFGFALFFLRSVAPRAVKTSDIYLGAIPFVLIQIVMVGLVICVPQLVNVGLGRTNTVDPDKVQIDIPMDNPEPVTGSSAPQSGSGDPTADEIQRQMMQEQGK